MHQTLLAETLIMRCVAAGRAHTSRTPVCAHTMQGQHQHACFPDPPIPGAGVLPLHALLKPAGMQGPGRDSGSPGQTKQATHTQRNSNNHFIFVRKNDNNLILCGTGTRWTVVARMHPIHPPQPCARETPRRDCVSLFQRRRVVLVWPRGYNLLTY